LRSFPACSPDGKKIAFVSNRDGDNEIYVMDADGTNVRQLTNNTADEWGPDWCWASTVEQMEFELESIKVFMERVFDVSPFDVPTEGYILLAIDASVISKHPLIPTMQRLKFSYGTKTTSPNMTEMFPT